MVISNTKWSQHRAPRVDQCYKPQMQGYGLILAAADCAVCPSSATEECFTSSYLCGAISWADYSTENGNEPPYLISVFFKLIFSWVFFFFF